MLATIQGKTIFESKDDFDFKKVLFEDSRYNFLCYLQNNWTVGHV